MTPSELRQQAARSRLRAIALESAAARLRVVADAVRHLLSDLSQRSRLVWQGPAATDFERRADEADADVKAQATLLASAAGDMETQARRLRSEANRLESEAAAAEAAAALPQGGGHVPVGVE